MRSQRLNYAIVGVFVLAMGAMTLVAAVALSGRSVARDSYFIVLDNVADIKFGTQVRFEGYPVGQVEEIGLLVEAKTTRFQIEVSVERGWRIPTDSIARVASSNFLGAKTLDIRQGEAEATLAPGEHIICAPTEDMFQALSDVAADIGEIARKDVRDLLARVSGLVANADGLLRDDVKAILGSVAGTAENLESQVPEITAELLVFAGQLNRSAEQVQKLLSDRNVEGVGRAIGNVEVVSRRLVQISTDVQGTLRRVDGVVAGLARIIEANESKVGAAVEDARYTLQAIARNIDSINHNLSGAARNMNEFSRLIRQNPGLLLDSSPRPEVKKVKDEPTFSLIRRDDQ